MSSSFSNGQVVLVISNSKALPILSHIKSQIGCSGTLEVIPTSELSQPSLRFKSEYFDVVMDPGLNFHDDTIFFEFSRVLKPGGTIFFQEPILTKPIKLGSLRTRSEFESAILISGLEIEKFGELKTNSYDNFTFVEELAKQISVPQEAVLQALQNQSLSFIEFSTKKPQIQLGSSHSLSFSTSDQLSKKTKPNPIPQTNTTLPKPQTNQKDVWKLSLEDMEDEELDFIEEEKLLLKEDLNKDKIVSFDPNNDCGTGTGKLKACKNCTCGRAELAESENQAPTKKITLEDLENGIDLPESSCGSCYLGDAFRCPTCPMLGLPSFKPNQKVKLNPN